MKGTLNGRKDWNHAIKNLSKSFTCILSCGSNNTISVKVPLTPSYSVCCSSAYISLWQQHKVQICKTNNTVV